MIWCRPLFLSQISVHNRALSTKPRFLLPHINQNKTAIKDANGSHSFEKLSQLSSAVSTYIRSHSVRGARVALLMPPSLQYAAGMIGTMDANCVPVPLNHRATDTELDYLLNNSETSIVLTTPETEDIISEEVTSICLTGDEGADVTPNVSYDSLVGGLMVYTSGTTGNPKGVLSGTNAFRQWNDALVKGWGITSSDSILHTLPLYHIHGILGIFSVLGVGGTVDLRQKFDPEMVWDEFLSDAPPSMYYGVPTQYSKLISYFEQHMSDKSEEVKTAMKRLRLMVSGSASLRIPVSNKWFDITGHRILERYGMTEAGMLITNPLSPATERKPGCVGLPFDGVLVRLVSEDGEVIATAENGALLSGAEHQPGEIQISGPTLFTQYFNKPEATKNTFTDDGWFKTGDTGDIHEGVFRILGRTNSDIIKSGGYKLSALEFERGLLDNDHIIDVAVIGIEDDTWGQKVVAIIESDLGSQAEVDDANLRSWFKDRMSPYKIPKEFLLVRSLPRNHMGKVNKKLLQLNYNRLLK